MARRKQKEDYKFLGNCPVCSKKFDGKDVTPIEEEGSIDTLYVECGKCSSSVVLGIMKNVPGLVTTVGMLTDMKLKDIERMADSRPITSDDVLEVHKYLERE